MARDVLSLLAAGLDIEQEWTDVTSIDFVFPDTVDVGDWAWTATIATASGVAVGDYTVTTPAEHTLNIFREGGDLRGAFRWALLADGNETGIAGALVLVEPGRGRSRSLSQPIQVQLGTATVDVTAEVGLRGINNLIEDPPGSRLYRMAGED